MKPTNHWMKKALVAVMAVAVVGALAFLVRQHLAQAGREEVIVLCGGTMRAPMEEIVKRYNAAFSNRILATYGDSGDLSAQLLHTGKGDIFVCHDPFMSWAEHRGLIAESATVAFLDNVIVFPKNNPKGIHGLGDLAQPGLRLGVGDRRFSTSGVMVKRMIEKSEYGAAISSNIVFESRGHSERCTGVSLGSLDAAIVWRAVAALFRDKLDAIAVPRDAVDAVTSATFGVSDLRNVRLTVGLTKSGGRKAGARQFYEYVTTQCRDVFEKYDFRIEKNDQTGTNWVGQSVWSSGGSASL